MVLKASCGAVPGCDQRLKAKAASSVIVVYDFGSGEFGPPHYIDTRFQSVVFARDHSSPTKVVFSVFGVVRSLDVLTSELEVLFPNAASPFWMPGISDIATLKSGDIVFSSTPYVIDDAAFIDQGADALSFHMPRFRERTRQDSSSVGGLSKAGPFYRLSGGGKVEPYRTDRTKRYEFFDIAAESEAIVVYTDKANLKARYRIAMSAQGKPFSQVAVGGNSPGEISVSAEGTRAVARAWSKDRSQWELMLVDLVSGNAETLPLHRMLHEAQQTARQAQ